MDCLGSLPLYARSCKGLRCLQKTTGAAGGPHSPTRKRCCSTARAAQASSKWWPPSRWRPSATCRWPIRPASPFQCSLSRRTRTSRSIIPPRAISSPSSPMARPFWGWATAARWRPSLSWKARRFCSSASPTSIRSTSKSRLKTPTKSSTASSFSARAGAASISKISAHRSASSSSSGCGNSSTSRYSMTTSTEPRSSRPPA